MNRFSLILSALSLILAGTSLWLSARAPRVDEAERRRLEVERGELARSVLALERRIAALQDERGPSGVRLTPPTTRVQPDEVAEDGAPPAQSAGAGASLLAALEDAPLDSAELIAGYRGLTDEARADALKELQDLLLEGDSGVLALVLDALHDPSAAVRERAVKMLGRLGDPAWLEHMQAASADPDADVRCMVARSLENLPRESAGPVLLGMLRDADPEVVDQAIKSLAKLDYREAVPQLLEQLRAEDLDVAARAASALRGMGDEGAALGTIRRILASFEQGGIQQRMDDVNRLRRIGGPTAVAELRRIMESDASLSVREEARQALIQLEQ